MGIQSDSPVSAAGRATIANRWINPDAWERPDMRHALAQRDIATVYRILQKFGVSQRRIAVLTQQAQSEVSEIVCGKRQVNSYEVLVRIADGLEVPRGWMGLAFVDQPPTCETAQAPRSGLWS